VTLHRDALVRHVRPRANRLNIRHIGHRTCHCEPRGSSPTIGASSRQGALSSTTGEDVGMGKYDALAAHLAAIPPETTTITLRFSEVDKIVGGLPPSARRIRQWWANDSKPEARAWRSAGWHVAENGVDFNGETVLFARGKVGGTMARRLGLE
jgi:hypothetical protein